MKNIYIIGDILISLLWLPWIWLWSYLPYYFLRGFHYNYNDSRLIYSLLACLPVLYLMAVSVPSMIVFGHVWEKWVIYKLQQLDKIKEREQLPINMKIIRSNKPTKASVLDERKLMEEAAKNQEMAAQLLLREAELRRQLAEAEEDIGELEKLKALSPEARRRYMQEQLEMERYLTERSRLKRLKG